MFAPGVAQLMAEFNSTSKLLATFVISIYILGYAFGPLLWAPLSEIYGRVYMYHIGNSVFVILCIGAALSKSLATLLTLRLFMGIFGSAPTTVGVGSIMDTVTLEWRGRILALWAMGPLLGPCIGPVIGGHITEGPGWRWVYWFLAILVKVSLVILWPSNTIHSAEYTSF
jgi:multidrug resistance protein